MEDAPAVAQTLGIAEDAWSTAASGWQSRMAEGAGDPAIDATYREALAAFGGTPPEITLETYRAICVAQQCGADFEPLIREHGLDYVSWAQVSYAWLDALSRDARMAIRFQLEMQRDVKRGLNAAAEPRRAPAALKTPDRVRARRCPSCGAHRLSPPTYGWLHCDFCGALFDYNVHTAPPADALDPQEVWFELLMSLDEQGIPGDDQSFADAKRWAYEVHCDVCPHAYPPRARDAGWRRRYIDDWLVPVDVLLRNNETVDAIAQEHYHKFIHMERDQPRAKEVFALFELARRVENAKADEIDRANLWSAHPENMDRALSLRVSDAAFVGAWVTKLSERDAEALIARAGLTDEFVAAPEVQLDEVGCARCGGAIVAVSGAERTVCGGCGALVAPGNRIACRGCGAPLVLPEGAPTIACGFCGVRWEAS